jgi:hypothetical protein
MACARAPAVMTALLRSRGRATAPSQQDYAAWADCKTDCLTMDQFVWDNPDFLAVVAAGNSGESARQGTVSSPGTSKNVLTVGAVSTYQATWTGYVGSTAGQDPSATSAFTPDAVSFFSGRGPTVDGRIKPDVVGVGDFLRSAGSNPSTAVTNDMIALSGTSMATPTIAGMATLLRDFLVRGKHPQGAVPNPSAHLVKALIVNSAEPVARAQVLGEPSLLPALPVLLDDSAFQSEELGALCGPLACRSGADARAHMFWHVSQTRGPTTTSHSIKCSPRSWSAARPSFCG